MSLTQPPTPTSTSPVPPSVPCLTGVLLLSLAGLRGWALSTAEAAPGARWMGGMEMKLQTL